MLYTLGYSSRTPSHVQKMNLFEVYNSCHLICFLHFFERWKKFFWSSSDNQYIFSTIKPYSSIYHCYWPYVASYVMIILQGFTNLICRWINTIFFDVLIIAPELVWGLNSDGRYTFLQQDIGLKLSGLMVPATSWARSTATHWCSLLSRDTEIWLAPFRQPRVRHSFVDILLCSWAVPSKNQDISFISQQSKAFKNVSSPNIIFPCYKIKTNANKPLTYVQMTYFNKLKLSWLELHGIDSQQNWDIFDISLQPLASPWPNVQRPPPVPHKKQLNQNLLITVI